MANKDFKVKNKLQVAGITSAGPIVADASGNFDSTPYIATQYGGTGTSTSPNSGQILYSSSGTNYSPTDLSSLTISSNGGSTITSSSASVTGLIIKGAASQTASIQEWQDSTGTVISRVGPYGSFGIGGPATGTTYLSVYTGNASLIGAIIKGAASQTANLQEWQNSAGTVLSKIESSGAANISPTSTPNGYSLFVAGAGSSGVLTLKTTSSSAHAIQIQNSSNTNVFKIDLEGRIVPTATTSVGLIIRGASSQTANLQEWQNSSGYVYASIDSSGHFNLASSKQVIFSSGIGTRINFGYSASYQIGIDDYTMALGVDPTSGKVGIRPSNATYGSSYVNPIELYSNGQIKQALSSASTIGLIIKGASSQSANLQEWQDSAGTVGFRVSSNPQIIGFNATTTAKIQIGSVDTMTYNASTGWVFTPYDSTKTGMVVKGVASQSANLLEYRNSSNVLIGFTRWDGATGTSGLRDVTQAGPYIDFSSSTIMLNTRTASLVGLTVKGASSQSANLQEWQNSSGNVLASISAAGNLTVQDLTVNGTTTTINSTTLTIDDKNIELASVTSPTDTTADGAGITIKGATDKTFNWVQSTGAFTSSEPISTPALSITGNSVSSNITLVAGKRYFVDTTAARTLTLPASPSLGHEIQVFDASGSAATNNMTINRNGGKINGVSDNLLIDVNGAAATLIYTGSTYGWVVR